MNLKGFGTDVIDVVDVRTKVLSSSRPFYEPTICPTNSSILVFNS